MAAVRVPGLYYEKQVRTDYNFRLGETGIPAFLGVTERGPLSEPTRVQSVEHFAQIFGREIPGSFLKRAVAGFFQNGGEHCFIVRVAHIFRRGEHELARKARYELLDQDGYPLIEIVAASEGDWGNEISVSCLLPETPRVQSFLTLDLVAGAQRATLQSTRGFEAGGIVRFRDGETEKFVTLTAVRGAEIFWRGGFEHEFKSAAPTYVEPVEFSLVVHSPTREAFSNLSLSPNSGRYFLRRINEHSSMIRVRQLESGVVSPNNLPEHIEQVRLRGGRDGLEGITPQDFIGFNNGPDARYGLGALEANEDVDLVVLPDLHYASQHCAGFRSERDLLAVHRAVVDHCERMGERFALLDLSRDTTPSQALDWRTNFDSSFAAVYYPWLVATVDGQKMTIPPTGHIAGTIAKCDREEGVHRAPANVALEGVVDTSLVLQEHDLAELNSSDINCIRGFAVRGLRAWGARTLSSSPDWRYITSRRIFNALRRALYDNTQWVVFEPNSPELRVLLSSTIETFMRELWGEGYFKGDSQDDAFFVVCDENNNGVEEIEEGLLLVDIGVALTRPTEFISLRLQHTLEDRRLGDLQSIGG